MLDKKDVTKCLQYYNAGRYTDAKKVSLQITKKYPKHPFGWKVLGEVLRRTGEKAESIIANKKALSLNPKDAEVHNNLGTVLKELGRLNDAEISLKNAIKISPNFAISYYNLGNIYKERGKLENAKLAFKKAISLNSNFVQAFNNLGNTLRELGELDKAKKTYERAIVIDPKFAEAYNNLGNVMRDLNKLELAIKHYKNAITLSSNFIDAYLNLLKLLEKSNQIGELELILKEIKNKNFSDDASFLYFNLIKEFRKENYKNADKLISKIKIGHLNNEKRLNLLKIKAQLFHYKEDFDSAFKFYGKMNHIVKESEEFKKHNPEKFYSQLKKDKSQLETLKKNLIYLNIVQDDQVKPKFMIGFPRSGTTLLDTILRSHSKTIVIEEKPMLAETEKNLSKILHISDIEKINVTKIKYLRNIYFNEVKKYSEIKEQKIIIDKFPLNILKIPLINKVFSNTKYIFVVRHPFDCILSCWMQNFKLNDAMSNMVDLDRIVDFYCLTMNIFELSKKRYKLDIHQIRYEDFVSNFKIEINSLLSFLDLKWEDQLMDYQQTALRRGIINTPSYSQVVKPIYSTASNRWEKYEKYLNKYKNKIDPWINKFGY